MILKPRQTLAMGRRHVQNELTICMQICADKSPNVNPLRPWKAVVGCPEIKLSPSSPRHCRFSSSFRTNVGEKVTLDDFPAIS